MTREGVTCDGVNGEVVKLESVQCQFTKDKGVRHGSTRDK